MQIAQWVTMAVGVLSVVLTGLSLLPGSHWAVRLWDFPRLQIAFFAVAAAAVYGALFFDGRPAEWAFMAAVAATALWQGRKIYPYTWIAPLQVQRSTRASGAGRTGGGSADVAGAAGAAAGFTGAGASARAGAAVGE